MLVVQVLRDSPSKNFFPTSRDTQESKGFFCSDVLHTRLRAWKPLSPPRKARRWLPRRQGSVCPTPRISFFGSRVFGFWETRLVRISAPTRLSLRGSHVRRKFGKRTTLRSESSTKIGLLYAGWRSCCEVFVARKAALSPWSEAWARKLSSDKRQSTFFHEFEILWWFPAWAVLCSLNNARKCQLEDFCEKERNESCSAQRTCIADAFRKVRKGENVTVVLRYY